MLRQKKKSIFIIFNLTSIRGQWQYKVMFAKGYTIYDIRRKTQKYFKSSGVEKDYMSVCGPLEIDSVLEKLSHLKLTIEGLLDGYTCNHSFKISPKDFERDDPYEFIAELAMNWEKHLCRKSV